MAALGHRRYLPAASQEGRYRGVDFMGGGHRTVSATICALRRA
jgi:hypothetical protein